MLILQKSAGDMPEPSKHRNGVIKMKPFMPQLVYIEPKALEYPLGKELKEKFEELGIEIRETTSHNQVRGIPGNNELQPVSRVCHPACNRMHGALPLLLSADNPWEQAVYPHICKP
ncbi:Spore photoproduct lyase [Mycobacteroides abscessus subsp. abscessus]|nr:Spore photoproduct lyase [Mycobacteroides abscessus subsp. abscessus]